MKLIAVIVAVAVLCGSLPVAAEPAAAPAAVIQLTFRTEVTQSAADEFTEAMKQIVEKHPAAILIVIDSRGGGLEAGWQMEKVISESPIPVHCIVDGEADSMAFVLLQACTTRGMTPTSTVLAHEPYFSIESREAIVLHLHDLRSLLLDLTASAERMAVLCAARMHMSLAAFQAKTDGIDWTMASATALKNHAVDYVSSVDQARTKLAAESAPAHP